MSTHFTVWCGVCKAWGPDIRRQAGGVSLNGQEDDWSTFLIEHEDHPLALVVEGLSLMARSSDPDLLTYARNAALRLAVATAELFDSAQDALVAASQPPPAVLNADDKAWIAAVTGQASRGEL